MDMAVVAGPSRTVGQAQISLHAAAPGDGGHHDMDHDLGGRPEPIELTLATAPPRPRGPVNRGPVNRGPENRGPVDRGPVDAPPPAPLPAPGARPPRPTLAQSGDPPALVTTHPRPATTVSGLSEAVKKSLRERWSFHDKLKKTEGHGVALEFYKQQVRPIEVSAGLSVAKEYTDLVQDHLAPPARYHQHGPTSAPSSYSTTQQGTPQRSHNVPFDVGDALKKLGMLPDK